MCLGRSAATAGSARWLGRLLGFVLGLLAVAPAGAFAATLGLAAGGAGAVRGSAPLVELALVDGRTAVLAGIVVPEEVAGEVAAALAPLLGRGEIRVAGESALDRYGRLVVRAAAPDGRSLQAALVTAGLALVQPLPGADLEPMAELLALERAAEAAGRGVWREPGRIVVGVGPEAMAARLGSFALVEGRVLQASAQQRYFYLNFGSDWRTDTTARIDRDTLRAMQRAGFDPAGLEGRNVRLRGTLFAQNGPMIELWTHQGIEVLP